MDEKLLMFQLKKDNWQVIEEMDNWLYVFDHLPKKMKLIVDFRVQGLTNLEISRVCGCSECNVRAQLSKAKKRFLRGESCI